MESRKLNIYIPKRLHISSQIFFGHVFVTSFLRNGGGYRGGASYIYIKGAPCYFFRA